MLSSVGDEIADGPVAGGRRRAPAARPVRRAAGRLFAAPPRPLYGADWRQIQPWILLTNYHRYVDQFVRVGLKALAAEPERHARLVLPGGIVVEAADAAGASADALIAASPWHRFQMPAYHLVARDGQGTSLVNIGVGPSNAKTITDHLAVLRPHCWLMVGHCGGLRQSQTIGDYVLAHAYLRRDRILDELVPRTCRSRPGRGPGGAPGGRRSVTGERAEALKQRLRTGTVVTYDDRNWELRWSQERRRINLSRAIGVDMESGTIAAQGYRLRVPYGTLLCVSDKPLHGEIKLPGAANAFYERAVGEHLLIGSPPSTPCGATATACTRGNCAASTSRRPVESMSLPISNSRHVAVTEGGTTRVVATVPELAASLGVDALIRLHEEDFFGIGGSRKRPRPLQPRTHDQPRRPALRPAADPASRPPPARWREELPVSTRPMPDRPVRRGAPARARGGGDADLFAPRCGRSAMRRRLAAALVRRYAGLFPDLDPADLVAGGLRESTACGLDERLSLIAVSSRFGVPRSAGSAPGCGWMRRFPAETSPASAAADSGAVAAADRANPVRFLPEGGIV